jgi:hypothetical protein
MMEAGYRVHLAIPAAMPQYSGLQYRMAEKGHEGRSPPPTLNGVLGFESGPWLSLIR